MEVSERVLKVRVDTYCPYCDREVTAAVYASVGQLEVRGELVSYDEHKAVCPCCGQVIGDSRVDGENLERAYDAYRALRGIVSPDEILKLRRSYGLSTREFSRFLGFGEQTEYRYETGSIPSRANNAIIKSAMTRAGASALLEENGDRIQPRTAEKVREYIAKIDSSDDESPEWIRLSLYERSELSPNAMNGFRSWNYPRIRELATLLAQRCNNLFVTKFQKAMFYADRLCFERTSRSITGLSYAHAFYGPIVHNKDGLLCQLQKDGTIWLEPIGDGEVVRSEASVLGLFSQDEMSVVEEVVGFTNTFVHASQIVEYSHGLSAWRETENGELMPYTSHVGEISKSIVERMGIN